MRYLSIKISCVANFVLLSVGTKAQNFVPNYSFEHVIKNPCKVIELEGISPYVTDWKTPTSASTDIWMYDESFANNCLLNTATYKVKPKSGMHCAGILMSSMFPENLPKKADVFEYREYIQVRLNKTIYKEKIYYAELYTSPLDFSSTFNNNLGLYFSVDTVSRYKNGLNIFTSILPYVPQVNNIKIIDNPYTWTKVSGCFKAKDNFQYLTIGNFYTHKNTDFTINPSPRITGRKDGGYYLIDDVLVREANVQEIPRAFGRSIDTTLCNNDSFIFRPIANGAEQYVWENGSTNPVRAINQPGVYTLTAIRGECSTTDTLRVKQERNPVLPPDTLLCKGEALQLSATHSSKQYIWNTGSTDSIISVSESGTYQLRIVSSTCQLVDQITVGFVDCPDTGIIPNTITPNGDGLNDTFRLDNIDLVAWQFEVYNRWGRQVYLSNPYRNEWDGGKLPSGTYYYLLRSPQLKRQLKGWVLILK